MKTAFLIAAIMTFGVIHAKELHVAKTGNNSNPGTKEKPFLTIQKAADLAQPGDIITVHKGIYRERINPPRGGESDAKRISYRAAQSENVVIKGSEVIKGWTKVSGDTWKTSVPAEILKDYNPYRDVTYGDWFNSRGRQFHTGAVYLNGHWMMEAARIDDVMKPAGKTPLWFCNDIQHVKTSATALFNIAKITVAGKSFSAADFQSQIGVQIAPCSEGGKCVGWINNDDRVFYDKVDFGKDTREISLRVASDTQGGIVEIRLGDQDGKVLGKCEIGNTGGWQKWTTIKVKISPLSGVQPICLFFKSKALKEKGLKAPEETIIWAQFKGINPNKELVEINVRPAVFYPDKPGRNYITVSGFTMEHAATQWAAPTAEQIGLIGVNWSKGWIIENNVVRYSNCVGISLGKDRSTGHNLATHDKSKDGTAHYHDVIKRALKIGWSKDTVGSHIVRNNHISHCEQAGIVGSLCPIFSKIIGNTIHDINIRGIYFGAEMAGIKFHAPIDTLIKNNRIYRCEKGIWLDWMTQGTRVTGNLFYDNLLTDLFIEVNHGPYLVDNNILLSPTTLWDWSQGGAYVHNLIGGVLHRRPVLGRSTPFHKPHSTALAGNYKIPGGDDRFYNNMFIGGNGIGHYGKAAYPCQAGGNAYIGNSGTFPGEKNPITLPQHKPQVKLTTEGNSVYLQLDVPEAIKTGNGSMVTTELLGKAKIPGLPYEDYNGKPLRIDTDYFGKKRNLKKPMPGPFENPETGKLLLKVWSKKKLDSLAETEETLPPLKDGKVPTSVDETWAGFDPRKEPLDVEVLKEWEEDGVVVKVLRYRIGIFKGKKAMMAAVYGYPKGGKNLPGLVQIHGGGQSAQSSFVVKDAKNGYATISIAWAGRINSTKYTVTNKEKAIFWTANTKDPNYMVTTDWGGVDAYHAPCRFKGNNFALNPPSESTVDPVKSPRNSGWFLAALGARRAITFLERQPQVDKNRIGVYGMSMGGKLTVLTAGSDSRIKAASPACGGISNLSKNGWTLPGVADDKYLERITCPIIIMSPSNDFHSQVQDLPQAVKDLKSKEWRVVSSPNRNHGDFSQYSVGTLLWFNQFLKGEFKMPKTPKTKLTLKTADHIPSFSVTPDKSQKINFVDVYYTQDGKKQAAQKFWRLAKTAKKDGKMTFKLPLVSIDKPLWVYADVEYDLGKTVESVGYSGEAVKTNSYHLASVVEMVNPDMLKKAGVKATIDESIVEEDLNSYQAGSDVKKIFPTIGFNEGITCVADPGGRKGFSIQIKDSPDFPQPWMPVLTFNTYLPPFMATSKWVFSADMMIDAKQPIPLMVDFRNQTHQKSFTPVIVDEKGNISARGKGTVSLCKVKPGTWWNFAVTFDVNDPKTFQIKITDENGTVLADKEMEIKPAMEAVRWLGFIPFKRTNGNMYVDNFKVKQLTSKAPAGK